MEKAKKIPAGNRTSFKKVMRPIWMEILVFALVILVFKTVLMVNYIPSGSMEDTVMSGEILISTRYDANAIQRYDIMVFKAPVSGVYFLKRVIGLPGETIEVRDGEVYANGVMLDSSFLKEEMDTTGDGIFTVPEGCYFMLGDNRNESWDSRYWEDPYVPLDNFVAHARLAIYPFSRFGSIIQEHAEE